MDGLSGVASVIAVLQLTQAVVSALSEYYQSARGAHEEIKSLATTLASLEALLKRYEEKIGNVTSNSAILDSLRSELSKLQEKLELLEGAGESKHGLKSLKVSLKWPFKKDDVAEKTKKIENLKTALVVELGIDTL
jgi:ankyrin repeat domain-containing protein 50